MMNTHLMRLVENVFILLIFISDTHLIAQDLRGLSMSLENSGNTPSEWNGQLDLYVDPLFEVDRPYVVVHYGMDTLWLLATTHLGGEVILKTYEGSLFLSESISVHVITIDAGQRVSNITNIPNSSSTAIIVNPMIVKSAATGIGNHPLILNYQTNIIEDGGTYIYSPNVIDPDGDSLNFELISCSAASYWTPPNTTIDPSTGTIISTPLMPGKYAYCVRIRKWRQINTPNNTALMGESYFEMVMDVNHVTGMPEGGFAHSNSFTLHPNPTSGILQVELHGLRPRELLVSDALGREVLRQGVPHANTGPLTLDLAPLSPGAYLVTVVDDQGMRFTQRVARE